MILRRKKLEKQSRSADACRGSREKEKKMKRGEKGEKLEIKSGDFVECISFGKLKMFAICI